MKIAYSIITIIWVFKTGKTYLKDQEVYMSDDRSIVCLFKASLKLNCYWKDDYQSHSINQPALLKKKTQTIYCFITWVKSIPSWCMNSIETPAEPTSLEEICVIVHVCPLCAVKLSRNVCRRRYEHGSGKGSRMAFPGVKGKGTNQ